MKRHIEAVHQELWNLECDEQVNNSLDCYKWFNNSPHCPNCGKGLTKAAHMKRHIEQVHLKFKNFKCKICSSSFYDQCKLFNNASEPTYWREERVPYLLALWKVFSFSTQLSSTHEYTWDDSSDYPITWRSSLLTKMLHNYLVLMNVILMTDKKLLPTKSLSTISTEEK